jgi:lauroyl/myristoyl acyltransferase
MSPKMLAQDSGIVFRQTAEGTHFSRSLNSISARTFRRQMARQLHANRRNIEEWSTSTSHDAPDVREELEYALSSLSANQRSAAFVCPHWGDYVSTFMQVASALPDKSRFVTFRGDRWNASEDRFWEAANTVSDRRFEVYRTLENKNILPAVRRMKSGAHLFVLFDLFRKFGDVRPVEFFDTRLHLTYGWATLCFMVDAVVVFLAPLSIERNCVEVFDVIDPKQFDDRKAFVDRCLRVSGKSLANLVSENPAFWFMWEHMDKYLAHE